MINKAELALKDLKNKHRVVRNHLKTLEEQVQALEKIVMFQSINQGLGIK